MGQRLQSHGKRADPLTSNRIVDNLPVSDRLDFLDHCETVELRPGQVLNESGQTIQHVYFPTRGFVSWMAGGHGRSNLQMCMVGREGMLGFSVLLGVRTSPLLAIVRGAGGALMMTADEFAFQLSSSSRLVRLINRYIDRQFRQICQTAFCTGHHVVEARVARLLLMAQDRLESRVVLLTHQTLADMLGVRRSGITSAAAALHERNLIRYRRGAITILDRRGLRQAACACYQPQRQGSEIPGPTGNRPPRPLVFVHGSADRTRDST